MARTQEFFISWAPELVSSDIDNTQGKGLFPLGFLIVHDELSPIDPKHTRDTAQFAADRIKRLEITNTKTKRVDRRAVVSNATTRFGNIYVQVLEG